MKVLIFSDIHGDLRALEKIANQKADIYIAAGDLSNFGKGLDRCGACIAGGRANDGRALTPRRKNMINELGEKLHRQVLEGERRPVKQFEHKKIGIELS